MSKAIHRENLNEIEITQSKIDTKIYLLTKYKDKNGVIIKKKLPSCDRKYWKIVNEEIKEMTATEKNTVNNKIAEVEKLSNDENLIQEKTRQLAIDALKAEGKL